MINSLSSDQLADLVQLARQYQGRARSSAPDKRVGAVTLTGDGNRFGGCNFEISYSASFSAEGIAIAKALTEGHDNFIALVIYVDTMSKFTLNLSALELLTTFSPRSLVIVADSIGNSISNVAQDLYPRPT